MKKTYRPVEHNFTGLYAIIRDFFLLASDVLLQAWNAQKITTSVKRFMIWNMHIFCQEY